MISSATLRETIVLIIFGVILVPIAAKRAQDAPGYWQTFSKDLSDELSSLSLQQYDEPPVWMLNAYDDGPVNAHELKVCCFAQEKLGWLPVTRGRVRIERAPSIANIVCYWSQHNMTIPSYAATGTLRSRSKTSTPVAKKSASTTTIRFQVADISPASLRQANAKPMENEHSSDAIKPPPSPPSPATASTTGARSAAQIKSAEPPLMVKTSEASTGSWRLIWMGSAMAAVAAFMSLC